MIINEELQKKIRTKSKDFQDHYKSTSKAPLDRKGESFVKGCEWMIEQLESSSTSDNEDGGAGNDIYKELSQVQDEYIDVLERSLALTTPIFWKNHGRFTDAHVAKSKELLEKIESLNEKLKTKPIETTNSEVYL